MFLVWIVPATWIVETKGPRMGALVSAAFILAGAAVRCLQWMFLNNSQSGLIFKILAHTGKKNTKNVPNFLWYLPGGILNGSMGPFCVTIPSVVSSNWFPPHQRTMATGQKLHTFYFYHFFTTFSITSVGLSWFLLEGGNALGFIIGPLMVTDPPINSTKINFTEPIGSCGHRLLKKVTLFNI